MIIITGATGFLGGRLVRFYREQGQEVLALGRNEEKLAQLSALGASVWAGDLASLPGAILPDRAQVLIHTAARSSPFGRYLDFYHDNVKVPEHLSRLLLSRPNIRMIHISTPAIYAAYQDQLNVVEESHLPVPVNHYADTKWRGEQTLSSIMDRSIILRPRGIYGRGDTALLPRMLTAARNGPIPVLRDGKASTDITHVDDVVEAIEAARLAPIEAWGRAYNISGPSPMRVLTVIEKAAARAGQPVVYKSVPWPLAYRASQALEWVGKMRGVEPRVTPYGLLLLAFTQTLNCEKAARYLKWRPRVHFNKGLDEVFGEAE